MVDCVTEWVTKLGAKSEVIQQQVRYHHNKRVKIDLRHLSENEINRLVEIAVEVKGQGWKSLQQSVDTLRLMRSNPSGAKINDLKALEAALIAYIRELPNKWLFLSRDGHRFPYYVTAVEYTPTKRSEGNVYPAHTTLSMRAADGESRGFTWYEQNILSRGSTVTDDIPSWAEDDEGEELLDEPGDVDEDVKTKKPKGAFTVPELLARKGATAETPALVKAYENEMEMYKLYSSQIGAQFSASGLAEVKGDNWYSSWSMVAMERDGIATKVVIDDGSEVSENRGRRGERSNTADGKFWDKGIKEHGRRHFPTEEADDEHIVVLPKHPWVSAFDLSQHQFINCHVADLEPYKWDQSLAAKLVLPTEHVDLIDALIRGADAVMEDIVQGKTGGTIMILTGPPGVGKTLTAEVFSERVKKPLYTVQCSQLGLSPTDLEKQLSTVLNRAARWKAILLIDEADVYVRHRGDDIVQNAMVGVWLRVLEYYRGILCLTSNKATQIDDAVMSRATAWVKYELPTQTELRRIWKVLSYQYQVNLSDTMIDDLSKRWPKASGRNVKNMLKLAKQLSNDVVMTMETFNLAARFLDVPGPNNSAKVTI